jgi:hypothetical protein
MCIKKTLNFKIKESIKNLLDTQCAKLSLAKKIGIRPNLCASNPCPIANINIYKYITS